MRKQTQNKIAGFIEQELAVIGFELMTSSNFDEHYAFMNSLYYDGFVESF